MRVPKRKSEESIQRESGPLLVTQKAFQRLQEQLKLVEASLPELIAEVERTKSFGDFSENAAYQDAKRAMRQAHSRVASLKEKIKRAEIIQKTDSSEVQLGSLVDVEVNGKKLTFEILGSHETNPTKGIISNTSPLGQKLMGAEVGDTITLELPSGQVLYTILEIR